MCFYRDFSHYFTFFPVDDRYQVIGSIGHVSKTAAHGDGIGASTAHDFHLLQLLPDLQAGFELADYLVLFQVNDPDAHGLFCQRRP